MSICSRENLENLREIFSSKRHSGESINLHYGDDFSKTIKPLTQTEIDKRYKDRSGMSIDIINGRLLMSCLNIQKDLPCGKSFTKDCQCFVNLVRDYMYSHTLDDQRHLIERTLRKWKKEGFQWESKRLANRRVFQLFLSTTFLTPKKKLLYVGKEAYYGED